MTHDVHGILVTGGTGTLGRAFADAAIEAGYRVRIMSRRRAPEGLRPDREWAQADLVTGEGLGRALRGADVVLHAASDPRGDPEAVDVQGTNRLLAAARNEGVRHLLYPSIVGIDRIPFSYYGAKEKAEALVAGSGVPYTTVRFTQFHSFVEEILSGLGRLPVMPVPTGFQVQSLAVEEAAAHLLDRLSDGPSGRAPDVAGPRILTLGEMARSWSRICKKRRWIVRLPVPGAMAKAFRQGRATAPDRAAGTVTWEEWLRLSTGNPSPAPVHGR